MPKNLKINWGNTLFLLGTPLIAINGIFSLIYFHTIPWQTWVLTGLMAGITGLSITAGYHRLFSHRAYEAGWLVRLFLLLFGAASFENSAKFWCADHRLHHQHVDKEEDPYNITKGFWHAHIGWIFYKHPEDFSFEHIGDLIHDPLVRFQDRFYYLIAVGIGFGLPTFIASFWGDPLGGLLVAGVARVVFNHHCTFFVNSLCHFIGTQPYSDKNTARDSWLMAFFTYGEGYHNFHHAFQADYRNGFRPWHWDPSKWFINLLNWIGLAHNLRRIPKERILFTRFRRREEQLLQKCRDLKHAEKLEALIKETRVKVEETYRRFQELKSEYKALKKEKMASAQEKLKNIKRDLKETKIRFKTVYRCWLDMTPKTLASFSWAPWHFNSE